MGGDFHLMLDPQRGHYALRSDLKMPLRLAASMPCVSHAGVCVPLGQSQPPAWTVNTVLSICCGLPSTTKRMLRMYFCASRCTSAGVTAPNRSRQTSEV